MLPCVCSVTDQRWRQKVIRASANGSCATFLFLPHFVVICGLLPNRRKVTWNLSVNFTTVLQNSLLTITRLQYYPLRNTWGFTNPAACSGTFDSTRVGIEGQHPRVSTIRGLIASNSEIFTCCSNRARWGLLQITQATNSKEVNIVFPKHYILLN